MGKNGPINLKGTEFESKELNLWYNDRTKIKRGISKLINFD